MNPLIQLKQTTVVFLIAIRNSLDPATAGRGFLLIALTLVWFGLASAAQAQTCFSLCDGLANTAVGGGALFLNTTGQYNTATGNAALNRNTAGNNNTANGFEALLSNTTGPYNMANGYEALYSNTVGGFNAANGALVLYNNTTGNFNTATGPGALLANTTGSNNVAVGTTAGIALTTGSGNVCIGAGVNGVAGESNTTRIRNIYSSHASGRSVCVNADNKIGTLASTRRVKENIKPMDKASEGILALKPVSFRYKKEIDASGTLQFGLVAEEVADINADLVTRDSEGKPETVRYEAVNAMLLNEFLKEHKKVEKQEATITRLTNDFQTVSTQQRNEIQLLSAQLKEQAAQIQKVSAQLEASKPAPHVVENNR